MLNLSFRWNKENYQSRVSHFHLLFQFSQDVNRQCEICFLVVDHLPPLWIAQFQALVKDSDPRVRQKVLALVAARRIPDLDAKLKEIAANQAESDDLRTAALGALVSYRPGLTTPGFQFLLGLLPVDTEADLRLSVAQVLSRAGLTSEQLLVVAREHLPGAAR